MLVDLPPPSLVVVNILAWAAIHLAVPLAVTRLRARRFRPGSWLYRERSWERHGELYTRLFRVERWKRLLPDGAALFKRGFRKKRLASRAPAYLERFRLETCRSELSHLLVILAAPLFWLWNPPPIGWVMISYALAVNLPCIVAQRYNRSRLNRVLGPPAAPSALDEADVPLT